jgi:hypothetical protein
VGKNVAAAMAQYTGLNFKRKVIQLMKLNGHKSISHFLVQLLQHL